MSQKKLQGLLDRSFSKHDSEVFAQAESLDLALGRILKPSPKEQLISKIDTLAKTKAFSKISELISFNQGLEKPIADKYFEQMFWGVFVALFKKEIKRNKKGIRLLNIHNKETLFELASNRYVPYADDYEDGTDSFDFEADYEQAMEHTEDEADDFVADFVGSEDFQDVLDISYNIDISEDRFYEDVLITVDFDYSLKKMR